ncbi:AAA family ATPase [Paraburkholderia bannensis]|uniref:AAA family ATPase n=1 Tax=Paraburkholderia bannensis TaxID=765414 RepID=UPI002AC36DCC|nr:AAA family ATPase [Paraburkholderia bannensis]
MQLFDRAAVGVPSILQGDEAHSARFAFWKLLRMGELRRAQTKMRMPDFSVNTRSIRLALEQLFHGKCAFCESILKGESIVHRFRPTADASPVTVGSTQHLYYGWLAFAWQNLYAICRDCDAAGGHEVFPVRGARAAVPSLEMMERYLNENTGLWPDYPIQEAALLLDPCGRQKPRVAVGLEGRGVLLAKTRHGKLTIQKFDLNRHELVARRRHVIGGYVRRLARRGPRQRMKEKDSAPPRIFDFKDMEFGGLWHVLLCDAVKAVGPTYAGEVRLMDQDFAQFYEFHRDGDEFRRAFMSVLASKWSGESPVQLQARGNEHLNPGPLLSIRIENFKSIEALEVRLPHPKYGESNRSRALLILGENAVGKSSILEAIALGLNDRGDTKFLGELERFRLNPSYLGSEHKDEQRVTQLHFQFERAVWSVSIDELIQPRTRIPAPPVFAYGAFRQFSENGSSDSPASSTATLFRQDAMLANPEDWLIGLEDSDFNMVIRALRDILSVEGDFDVVERDKVAKRCYVVSEIDTADGTKRIRAPLAMVSSGFRSVLAMTCDIFRRILNQLRNSWSRSLNLASGIVLIDEVEAHLHPRWKMQIMRGLRSALPRMLFIVTSHDPLCLRGMEDGEVVVMRRVIQREPTSGIVVKVELNADLPPVSQLTVEQLLTADFFGLLSTDEPQTERSMADIADLLAKRDKSGALSAEDAQTLARFEAEIAQVLPIGSSEAQRLVQEAVAEYLTKRREATNARVAELRKTTRQRILDVLEGV